MVIMATRQREVAFPHINIVASQQRALQLPWLLKLEMTGFEFYPVDVGVPGGEAQLVHLTKAGCAALGVALGYMVASNCVHKISQYLCLMLREASELSV
jgi:hypothetical protein